MPRLLNGAVLGSTQPSGGGIYLPTGRIDCLGLGGTAGWVSSGLIACQATLNTPNWNACTYVLGAPDGDVLEPMAGPANVVKAGAGVIACGLDYQTRVYRYEDDFVLGGALKPLDVDRQTGTVLLIDPSGQGIHVLPRTATAPTSFISCGPVLSARSLDNLVVWAEPSGVGSLDVTIRTVPGAVAFDPLLVSTVEGVWIVYHTNEDPPRLLAHPASDWTRGHEVVAPTFAPDAEVVHGRLRVTWSGDQGDQSMAVLDWSLTELSVIRPSVPVPPVPPVPPTPPVVRTFQHAHSLRG